MLPGGFQIRMTALVTVVVLLVSTVIMLMIEVRVRTDYGRMLNDRLEEAIRKYPEQYLWSHRRWRDDAAAVVRSEEELRAR